MENKIRCDKNSNIVGENIRKFRMAEKMTQEQLVAKLQLLGSTITRGGLAKLECGKRNVSVEELKLLKNILHLEYKELLE